MATHSATPQEDIGAILERFQQWTGDQSRPAAASDPNAPLTGFQRSAHQAYSSTRQITRELSYEEALSRARSRTRRPWEDEEAPAPATPQPQTANPPEARPKAPAAAAPSKSRKPSKSAPEKSTMKTAATSAATRAQTQTQPQPQTQTQPQTQPRKTSAAAHRKTRAVATSKKSKSQPRVPATAPAAKKPQDAAPQGTGPQTGTASAYDLQPSPSFQQILTAQMQGSPIPVPAALTPTMAEPTTVHAEEVSGTAVTVTVHLSVTERNALRTRAQQLGLSADAYLRQCALEVESLRSELQELLVTRMQATRQLPAQPRPNWLGRLKQYFFPSRTDCQTRIFHA
jgi:hypothetical protein